MAPAPGSGSVYRCIVVSLYRFLVVPFQARQREAKQRRRVYCNEISHASVNCPNVVRSGDRKKYLSERRLCFNCTGAEHRASECRSRSSCSKCKRRHHTSICDAPGENGPPTAPTNTGY